MKHLFLLLLFVLISCSEDPDFACSNCKEYEKCNEEAKKCELKSGHCLKDSDCTEKCDKAKNICVSNTVICTEGNTKCSLDNLLTCESNSWKSTNCAASNKVCETKSKISSCVKLVVKDGTIYPIRKGEVDLDSAVVVNGSITGIKLDGEKVEGLYIQEEGREYRGIYVYAKDRLTNTFKIGDEVKVSGIYKEYKDLSEIIVKEGGIIDNSNFKIFDNFKILSLNNLVTQKVEKYESMLVELSGEFSVESKDDHGNFVIKDKSGSTFIIKNDLYNLTLEIDNKLSKIRGVLTYNYNSFKILPRSELDLIDNSILCASLNCETGEICKVTNKVASCICDNVNGYFDNAGSCKNPCTANVCTEAHKQVCTAIDVDSFNCTCDTGYEENNGTCKVAPYCDEATYGSAFGKTGDELKAALKVIIEKNYQNFGKDNGRNAMFSHIYNENGVIRCVYTGEYYNFPYQENRALQTKPDNDIFNWEHTWPQSMGLSAEGKADLHHMYPTRSYVNSARSNYPFGYVDGGDEYGSGDYISRRKNSIFEPADQHKGNVARAMFYMWIKYNNSGGFMDRNNQFELFKEWHALDPIDEKEHQRNDIIETYQHNRNPFVDCPQFIEGLTN